MSLFYFAYGSNMSTPRLRARVASAESVSSARLDGFRLEFSKRSDVDGSGKCTLTPSSDPADAVWGVLFRMDRSAKEELNRIEGLGVGYEEITVTVTTETGPLSAATYIAAEPYRDPALRPMDWYKEFVVSGAEEHRLPETYIEALRAVSSQPDPDARRASLNRSILRPPETK